FAMRTLHPEAMAEFYSTVFELNLGNRREGDENYYLSDGHITLVIMPWDITHYEGTGIILSGMDHIGFKVEDLDETKQDIERIAADNPRLAPAPVGAGPEGKKLAELFERSCPIGSHRLADCDGILIDIHAD
ncbi:MAG: VOC family protein, partial [Micropepsaceae bacterium]